VPPVDFLQLIKNSHISSHTAEQYWMPDAFDARMEVHTLKSCAFKATLCDFYPHLAVKSYMTIQ